MNLYQRLRERMANDEPPVPFDAEPAKLTQLDPDPYDQPDIGDEHSQ